MDEDRVKGSVKQAVGTALEDPQTIRLKIRHYQEVLKLGRQTAEARGRVIDLLAEAHAQLPFAEGAKSRGNRWE